METGMLWFDNTPGRAIETKVRLAAEFFQLKYGLQPTECEFHPVEAAPEMVDAVRMQPSRTVLPNHLLIGVGQGAENKASDSLLTAVGR